MASFGIYTHLEAFWEVRKKNFFLESTQLENSGHRIPTDPEGKKRERHEDPVGNYRNRKQYSSRKIFGYFPMNFEAFLSDPLVQRRLGQGRGKWVIAH